MRLIKLAVAGVTAGALGTLAMDILWFRRYRRGGGAETFAQWEFAEDTTSWETVSAPGEVGEKVLTTVLRKTPPDCWARTATNVVHWGTGTSWGVAYAMARAFLPRPIVVAVALGPVAWIASYVVLPMMGVYRPIWTYDAATLMKDFSAHLVFGATTATAFAAVTRRATRA
ncbi:hypothetical protein [Microbacterium aquimaris]|uniref:DUF1440 domain-containing protein n=1 Tax=Microbacterium aquimaris TaxID=459816 RepID=A0ABU5N314_9MICO|nr:hypothetical protein [Microbacterium aquimaris]MDZ8160484.1 hypothetical protein [Microbacterium aquimaris]